MGAQAVILRGAFPSILFVSLAAFAHHVMLGGTKRSGAGAGLLQNCLPGMQTVTSAAQTGVAGFDKILCILVTFFQAAFTPEGLPLMWGFGTTMTAFIALMLVESSRAGRAFIFAWPTTLLLGLMCQLQGIGVWSNVYWLATIAFRQLDARRGSAVAVGRVAAEANLFATLVGFALPSQAMLSFQTPLVIAAWQFFPVWVLLARGVYMLVRPRSTGNGYKVVQATYLTTFALSAYGNALAVWLLRDNLSSYLATLPPPIEPPTFAGSTLTVAALHFLTWDWIMTAVGGLLATLWIAKSPAEIALIAAWNILATPLLGAGAAVSGALMWREKRLNGSK